MKKILIIAIIGIAMISIAPNIITLDCVNEVPTQTEIKITEPVLEEESYIDDIPFDTREVVKSLKEV